jgi:TrmH family RNA methyltransferase
MVAVAGLPDDELFRVQVGPSFLGAVSDRPNHPGNIGPVVRLRAQGLPLTVAGTDESDTSDVVRRRRGPTA